MLTLGAGVLALWWWLRVPAIDSNTDRAVELFSRVLNGEANLRPRALSALAGAIERDPQDARAHLWFGLANMHGYLEHRTLPYAIRATRAFDRAVQLDPANRSAEGWRAFFAYQAAVKQEDDLAEPTRALLAAGRADPGFTSFLVAVALAKQPRSTGYPGQALPPLRAAGDCGDGTTHRCRISSLFPHAAEGYHATLGDLLVRLGRVDEGQREYQKALAQETAHAWPYRKEFIRWVEQTERRAARLSRDDAPKTNRDIFFASGPRACAACHEK